MVRLSLKEAKALGIDVGDLKESKYHSQKVTLDGITFDSQKEANKYAELRLLQMAGEVTKLELQPEFILQEGYRDGNGKWHRPIKYRADFRVIYRDGRVEVIETKGFKTRDYLIKKKMFLARYPEINFMEV
jgi:hypothetical protein